MQNSDPRDRFFYRHLTPMKDSYDLWLLLDTECYPDYVFVVQMPFLHFTRLLFFSSPEPLGELIV